MADPAIESVVLAVYARVSHGTNGDKLSTLDPARHGYGDMRLAEGAHGVTVSRESGFTALIPWSQVVQVIYAPAKAAPPAKAK